MTDSPSAASVQSWHRDNEMQPGLRVSEQAHPPATNEAFLDILLLQKINALPSNRSNSPSSCSQSAVLHENHPIYSWERELLSAEIQGPDSGQVTPGPCSGLSTHGGSWLQSGEVPAPMLGAPAARWRKSWHRCAQTAPGLAW